jgi:hypothetical protein
MPCVVFDLTLLLLLTLCGLLDQPIDLRRFEHVI